MATIQRIPTSASPAPLSVPTAPSVTPTAPSATATSSLKSAPTMWVPVRLTVQLADTSTPPCTLARTATRLAGLALGPPAQSVLPATVVSWSVESAGLPVTAGSLQW